MNVDSLIHKLFELGAIKFGQFTLKSGIVSPIYIDLRLTISSPKLLVFIAEMMHEKMRASHPHLICGVPYGAVPYATAISIQHSIPMILCRKAAKDHGTKKQVEGVFEKDQSCALVEDVITSGQSIYETITSLLKEELTITDIVVIVDREQGGKQFLEKKGFKIHSLCTVSDIVAVLSQERKITPEIAESVKQFIQAHQI